MCHQNTCHLCPDLFADGFIPKRCVDLITVPCLKDAIHQLDMKLEREAAAGNRSLLFTFLFLFKEGILGHLANELGTSTNSTPKGDWVSDIQS